MARKTINMTEQLAQYIFNVVVDEHHALQQLREVTASHEAANMQVAPEQGAFMQMLVKLIGAKRCIEIGTFTGYSAMAVALALPADGELIACDISTEFTDIGKPFWEQAGVANKIALKIAPALETLDALLAAGEAGKFDFAFIDANKTAYPDYYERCVELVRSGGLVAIDNVLWDGKVADSSVTDNQTSAIRAVNERASNDSRVESCLVPIADGLMLVRKI